MAPVPTAEQTSRLADAQEHVEFELILLIEMTMITGISQEQIEDLILSAIRKKRFERCKVN